MLKDVLKLVPNKYFTINIELKAGNRYYPLIEELVLEDIHRWAKCNIIISSFDHFALRNIKEIDNTIITGVLYNSSLIDVADYAIEKVNSNALHPYYMTLENSLIVDAHKKSLMINPFTVDIPGDIKRLIQYKVDNLITNYPDIALTYL